MKLGQARLNSQYKIININSTEIYSLLRICETCLWCTFYGMFTSYMRAYIIMLVYISLIQLYPTLSTFYPLSQMLRIFFPHFIPLLFLTCIIKLNYFFFPISFTIPHILCRMLQYVISYHVYQLILVFNHILYCLFP